MGSIGADDHAALQFEDIASALDAGLPLESITGADPKSERAIHEALRQRGVVLAPTEDAVLLAAWRAGRVTNALRARGAERRSRADFRRTLRSKLAYPCALIVATLVASVCTAPVMGHWWFAIGVFVLFGAAIGFLYAAYRGLRRGDERWMQMPIIGPIVRDLAELPYLETLHSMYSAGVPLLQAHSAAVAAVPVVSVQQRLRIADRVLQEGRSLTESLAQSVSLQQETRLLLATGEQAGQLEDALQRALVRRREVTGRAIAETARRFTVIVTTIVTIVAAVLVWSFYANYLGALGKMLKH